MVRLNPVQVHVCVVAAEAGWTGADMVETRGHAADKEISVRASIQAQLGGMVDC